MTWKEWLEGQNVPGERLPSELQCRRYALISRYPEVLAMFREAMKQQGSRSDFHDNIMEVKASQGTSRAYSVTRVQQECNQG